MSAICPVKLVSIHEKIKVPDEWIGEYDVSHGVLPFKFYSTSLISIKKDSEKVLFPGF